MSCSPQWFSAGQECPYGKTLPLSVTLPDDANGWEVISVGYGYVPWVVCFSILVLFVVYRGTRELAVGIGPCLAVAVNELVKKLVEQQRPIGSCLTSCGMPSSHAATSISLLVYFLLDAGYRVRPPITPRSGTLPECDAVRDTSVKLLKGLCCLPFSWLSQYEFTAYLAIWMPLLLPVGISRVILMDHSASQVMAGGFIGMFVSMVWFWVVLWFRQRFSKYSGQKFGYIFVHNYEAPGGWDSDDRAEARDAAPLVVDGAPAASSEDEPTANAV